MRLTELEPQFITYGERPARGRFLRDGTDPLRGNWTDADFEERDFTQHFSDFVETLARAQGIWFDCPGCFAARPRPGRDPVGTHGVDVTFADRGVPDHLGTHNKAGQPVRWAVTGTGYDDLSTTPSILLEGGCGWHGFITNGEVT